MGVAGGGEARRQISRSPGSPCKPHGCEKSWRTTKRHYRSPLYVLRMCQSPWKISGWSTRLVSRRSAAWREIGVILISASILPPSVALLRTYPRFSKWFCLRKSAAGWGVYLRKMAAKVLSMRTRMTRMEYSQLLTKSASVPSISANRGEKERHPESPEWKESDGRGQQSSYDFLVIVLVRMLNNGDVYWWRRQKFWYVEVFVILVILSHY